MAKWSAVFPSLSCTLSSGFLSSSWNFSRSLQTITVCPPWQARWRGVWFSLLQRMWRLQQTYETALASEYNIPYSLTFCSGQNITQSTYPSITENIYGINFRSCTTQDKKKLWDRFCQERIKRRGKFRPWEQGVEKVKNFGYRRNWLSAVRC